MRLIDIEHVYPLRHTLADVLMTLELADLIDNDEDFNRNQHYGLIRGRHVWVDTWLRDQAIKRLAELVAESRWDWC